MKPEEIERPFRTGECIVDRGDSPRELYVIRDGEVRVEPGERMLGAGDLVAEIPAITGRPSEARAVAASDGTLLVIDLALLQGLCTGNPEFGIRLIRALAERVHEGASEADASAASRVAARVAGAILLLAEPPGAHAPVGGKLAEIASEAGVGLLAAYHEIQALLEEKVVRLADDELQVVDRPALESMASPD